MKRVLISGGSRGIGAALVAAFAAAGHRVAFLYRANDCAAERVAADTGALAIKCDVSVSAEADAAVACASEWLGGAPQVFVGNAGISSLALSRDLSDEAWRRLIDTNLSGNFYLARALQGAMIAAQEGRMIFIGSMWGKVGASMEVAYSASKAALRGLTMALAKELGPSGITVNCVEPGLIDTEMNRTLDDECRQGLIDETPLCRIGRPEDVAAAVLFFASEQASFVTGQTLGVDGGYAI